MTSGGGLPQRNLGRKPDGIPAVPDAHSSSPREPPRALQPPAKAEPQPTELQLGSATSDESARCALLLMHRNLSIEVDRVSSLISQLQPHVSEPSTAASEEEEAPPSRSATRDPTTKPLQPLDGCPECPPQPPSARSAKEPLDLEEGRCGADQVDGFKSNLLQVPSYKTIASKSDGSKSSDELVNHVRSLLSNGCAESGDQKSDVAGSKPAHKAIGFLSNCSALDEASNSHSLGSPSHKTAGSMLGHLPPVLSNFMSNPAGMSNSITKSNPMVLRRSKSALDAQGARKALYTNSGTQLGQTFEAVAGLLIITSAFLNGIEVQYQSQHLFEDLPIVFTIIRNVYTIMFTMELFFRVKVQGFRKFLCNKEERLWAWLDCFVVAASLFELVIDVMIHLAASNTEGFFGQTFLRNARLIRMVRTARAFRLQRLIRFINPLRTLVYSIMATLKSLGWALVLLVGIMYMFGLAFTMEAVYFIQAGADTTMEVQSTWGSLDRSMYSLFESITGGVSWREVERPLERISLLPAVLFTIYIAFVYFAVLNTVTGVFCTSAIETTQRNPELVARSIIDKRVACSDKLEALFGALDDDGSGLITIDELEIISNDEMVKAYFQALEIDFRDAYQLFKLIDVEKEGVIKKDDFLAGCEKLRGGATSMELAELHGDVQRLVRQVEGMRQLIKETLGDMKSMKTSMLK